MSKAGRKTTHQAILLVLILGLFGIIVASLIWGRTPATYGIGTAIDGVLQSFGMDRGISWKTQSSIELRLWRVLTTAGVGSALAYAGALLQGTFRNGLAAPSIIGVTAGASLGAALTILFLGGLLPTFSLATGFEVSSFGILLASFAGSFISVGIVVLLASERGRVSIPSLLLTGIAVNACLAGLLSAIHSYALKDYEVSRAIFSWTFGNLDDKNGTHVFLVWAVVLVGSLAIPRLATELDLFAGGEDDARSLGVATGRTKFLAISIAALMAATAVAVAGQIGFVGLVVPHLVRLIFGTSHRQLLPFSIIAGAFFLTAVEFIQGALLKDAAFQPGVMTSLVGGPFFLLLLVRKRGSLRSW